MKTLITIAGRAGSKGLPGKNMRPFCGKPLVFWSIDQALDFSYKVEDEIYIVVNSDSKTLLSLVNSEYEMRLDTVSRPKELAIDEAGKMDVIRYTLRHMEDLYSMEFDQVVDLDITNPIRRVCDIKAISYMLMQYEVDSVLSVVPARRSPYFNQVEGREGISRVSKTIDSKIVRRQDSPTVWDLNCCLYAYKRDWLNDDNNQHPLSNNSLIYTMPDYSFCETDTLMDFELAEYMFKKYVGVK